MPRRIHVTGGQASGKTTLAARLCAVTGLPTYELDLIARVGGGNGPERPPADRVAMTETIAAGDAWITEGTHLGWTRPLLDRAEVILWLDHVSPTEASGRIVHRFLAGAAWEIRTRRGRERFLRFGDYLRHTRELGGALRRPRSTDDDVARAAALEAYRHKLVRCRSNEDIEAFIGSCEASVHASETRS